METPVPPWQPITFGGVAAFSRASLGRLVLVQLLAALVVAVSVISFLSAAWFPVLQKAIARLPERGAIRGGQLEWNSASPTWLAEGPFLSIVVDAGEGGLMVHDAHHAEPSAAFALSRLTQSTWGATPVGVFRDVERPVYDELMAGQLDVARQKREGDLAALLGAGDTWTI